MSAARSTRAPRPTSPPLRRVLARAGAASGSAWCWPTGVRLVAPMTPVTETLAEGERAFAGLFELIPDLTGEVIAGAPPPTAC